MGGSISKKNSEAERLNARALEGNMGGAGNGTNQGYYNINTRNTNDYDNNNNDTTTNPSSTTAAHTTTTLLPAGGGPRGYGGGGGGPTNIPLSPPSSAIPMNNLSGIPPSTVNTVTVTTNLSSSSSSSSSDSSTPAATPQAVVPTVFRWEHGGNQVYITGTFNNWSRRIPMHRSGNDFLYIQSLPVGKHAYKFVVDDEWRFAPDQATIADTAGNINNYIDLTTFIPDNIKENTLTKDNTLPGIYGYNLPEEDEYGKDPPLLPPHLRQIILNNNSSPDITDSMQLPVPLHVSLNHLYCTAIRDGLMVQAITQRYRRKHTTSVYYTVMPLSSVQIAQQQQQQQQQQNGGNFLSTGDGNISSSNPLAIHTLKSGTVDPNNNITMNDTTMNTTTDGTTITSLSSNTTNSTSNNRLFNRSG